MMMDEKSMMERCEAMMKQKQKMMESMQAADTELTQQVAKMNSASGDEKVSMIAEIVTKLVKQRADMHDRMAKMQGKMMGHAMMHVRMGKDSCEKCPMMKGSDGDKTGTAGEDD